MANTFSQLMGAQRVGMDRIVVGAKPKKFEKKPVVIKLAMFFDGTSNNRTNVKFAAKMRDPKTRTPGLRQDNIDYLNNNLRLPFRPTNTGISFTRGLTNVAILEELNERNRGKKYNEVSVYVEGSGSTDFDSNIRNYPDPEDPAGLSKVNHHNALWKHANGEDDIAGLAAGTGNTGLIQKTKKGIKKAEDGIRNAYDEKTQFIKKIFIDVYGFSRGAAQARYFIYLVNKEGALCTGVSGWPQNTSPEIIVNFVGLYDTVCASTELLTGPRNIVKDPMNAPDAAYGNSVREYHLDMRDIPKQVVQLTAADEYKRNFSLVNIESSRAAGVGFELALPGCHGDSGGGSRPSKDNVLENLLLTFDEVTTTTVRFPTGVSMSTRFESVGGSLERRNFLVAGGWYTPEQLNLPAHLLAAQTGNRKEISVALGYRVNGVGGGVRRDGVVVKKRVEIARSRFVPAAYSLIPLRIMVRLANGGGNHSPTKFKDPDTRAAYRVPPELKKFSSRFLAQAMSLKGSKKHEAVTCASDEDVKLLRNKFLRVSALDDSLPVGERKNFRRLIIPDVVPEGGGNNNYVAGHPNYGPKK